MPILHADYSQMELRVATLVWPDDNWISDILSGDMHARTVERLLELGRFVDDTPDTRRTKAKNGNFGVLYLSGGEDTAAELGISVEEMKHIIAGHKEAYPDLHEAQARDVERMWSTQEIVTITGMPHKLAFTGQQGRDNETIRTHANALVQGPAAQMTKLAGALARRWILRELRPRGFRVVPINNVHDALDFDAPEEELPELERGIRRIMTELPTEDAWGFKLPVPLEVDVKVGPSWGDIDLQEWDEEKRAPFLERVEKLRRIG